MLGYTGTTEQLIIINYYPAKLWYDGLKKKMASPKRNHAATENGENKASVRVWWCVSAHKHG